MNDAVFQVFPRTVQRETPLAGASIIYPADAAYRQLAEALADTVEMACGQRPALHADTDLMPSRAAPLPTSFRQHTLILLGGLGTNRAILPLYARYACATDAAYPGGDGYDLRTILNPYGTGANVILAGGSSPAGVRRAVERLCASFAGASRVPFLLDVELDPALAEALAQWPDAPLDTPLAGGIAKTHALNEDRMKLIGAYGIIYVWTGDRRYGEIAGAALRSLNAEMDESYGDWHYRAERMLRVLPHLIAGGFLADADVLRTDQLLLGTALGTAGMWWRMREGRPPLGHRHQGRGTFEFLLLARYLAEQANPSAALRRQCEVWIAESQAYLDALGAAEIDDQDDESTLTNLATVFWYALAEERFAFFESGSARRVALRALALHDNLGAGTGQGGYGEGFPGMWVMQSEATVPLAASAFYDDDGGLRWVLEHLPHLKAPLISGFLHFSPLFMHIFDAGGAVPAQPPAELIGLRALPITAHQLAISAAPPEHVEFAGHSVNAPETWRRGEGIGVNTLPASRGFDKLVLRGGFAPTDPYLLLQGYQGGFRWQGHMQAANCIVRFSQAGHVFLIQNTTRHSHYQKNGLFISDGFNDTPLPPIAEQIALADFERVALSSTRLADFHHADWTRHIFWLKPDGGLFVVIDSVAFAEAGDYALTCTWRTPAFAALDGDTWRSRQGDHVFTLQSAEALDATCEEEADQGGVLPFVLRQRKMVSSRSLNVDAFQNLFFVRPAATPEALAIHKLTPNQAFLSRDGQPFALCAVAPAEGEIRVFGLKIRAVSAFLTPDEIAISGLLSLETLGWRIESDRPISLSLDLAAGRLSASGAGAALTLTLENATSRFVVNDLIHVSLPLDICYDLSNSLRAALSELRAAPAEPHAEPAPQAAAWSPRWSFNGWTPLPRRLRDLTISASPPPLDGFPDQLIDGVVAEIRQTRQQWPTAQNVEIVLKLSEETPLDHLRIVGDSRVDPTLRTFHPLPAGISVEVSSDDFRDDVRPCPLDSASGVLGYKLFRDIEDQLETRTARVDSTGLALRVRVPAPADDRPLVLHEIEVYGSDPAVPSIQFMLSADLQGDGQPVALIANAANELIALSSRGELLWRKQLAAPVTHLSAHDLHGNGCLSVCVGLLGGTLHIFAASGESEKVIPLAQKFAARRDAYFGRVYTIHSVAVWAREADGRAALVVGGYSVIGFLDADGEIVGHSWADGSWQSDILVQPGSGDLWVRSGWNHGIGHYAGRPDCAPSGETVAFGGVQQPMFRGLRRVIPFVNGKTVAFEWLDGGILAAAENGVGVLSTERGDWRWAVEGGTPITACLASGGEVIVGGADGFIAAFAQADGTRRRRLPLDAPVVGLAALGGSLAVATRRGLLLLDREWRVRQAYTQPLRRLLKLSGNTLVIVRDDGALAMLEGDADDS